MSSSSSSRRSVGLALLILVPLLFMHALSDTEEAPVAPMEKAEQDALFLVIGSFVGASWNSSGLYLDPCGSTPIQGISCDLFDGLWYVTAVSIGPVLDNSLECAPDAKFTTQLFDFKHLRTLSIFNCFSSPHQPVTIPSRRWKKLARSLETLEFRSNQGLVGEIPAGLSQLVNLQSLVLVNNALTGKLPTELGKLIHLKRLALRGNQFLGEIPATLGYNLSELLILDLSRNSLKGPLPPSFGAMTALLKLDMSNNLVNGRLPQQLGRLSSLTLLDLRNNSLTGGLSQSLQGLVSLQDMLLSNNPLGGSIMKFGWKNLSNLTTLDLANICLRGSIPESITKLRRLRVLALDNNHLSGTVPPELAALPSLTVLYLNMNNFTGELGFSEEFYERMGRKFACWNNSNLCYASGMVHVPLGVEQCKHEKEVSFHRSDTKNKMGNGNPDKNSSLKASINLSVWSQSGFWWTIVIAWLVFVLI